MMKQRRNLFGILSMVLALALLLTGCTTGGGNGTTTAATTSFSPSNIEDDASLSIYIYTGGITTQKCYVNDVYDFYADYKNMIDITIEEFTDADEMESRLKIELAAGQGPDIIMANMSFNLDIMSLAKNGAFYDMTDIIAADETFTDESYYLSVMEAGQLNDRQYIVPLSFTLPTFVSTTTALSEMGINLETDTTIEFYEKMLAHLKSAKEPQVSTLGGYTDTIMALMQSCGITPVSYETGEVNLDSEESQMLIEFGAMLYAHGIDWLNRFADSSDLVTEIVNVPIIYTNYYTSPCQLQLYYSSHAANGKADEVVFYFAPDEDGNHHALVQEFSAVNANAKNPKLAWLFLKLMMGHTEERNTYTALSLKRDVTAMYVQQMTTFADRISGNLSYKPMPQEYANQLLNVCDTIGSASIQQKSLLTTIFNDAILDYFNSGLTLDTMVEDVSNKVKLYINE